MELETRLKAVKRVVIKVGTHVIDDETTYFNRMVIESLVKEIADLMSHSIEVLLVSSGAVGAGIRALGVKGRPSSIHLKQAYAAVGQSRLMNVYSQLFSEYNIITAQVLLTRSDLDRRDSYLNARATLEHLVTIGILPIINENDTVANDELKFGDNDTLASLVAGKMDANLLIMLTTVDGLYRNYGSSEANEVIDVIDMNEFDQIQSYIHDTKNPLSMGGMKSKIQAARVAASKGIPVVIANGLRPGIIHDVFLGKAKATWIMPSKKRMAAWKHYLAFAKRPSGGKLIIDDGAVKALCEGGKSLLVSGIREATGSFQKKDLVQITDLRGREIARGLVNVNSNDLRHIKQLSNNEVQEYLHTKKGTIIVHRDNLVLI